MNQRGLLIWYAFHMEGALILQVSVYGFNTILELHFIKVEPQWMVFVRVAAHKVWIQGFN
jgi:hypothetical protein